MIPCDSQCDLSGAAYINIFNGCCTAKHSPLDLDTPVCKIR